MNRIPQDEEFLLAVAGISTINAISIPNVVQLIYNCILITNMFVSIFICSFMLKAESLQNRMPDEIQRVFEFLEAPLVEGKGLLFFQP